MKKILLIIFTVVISLNVKAQVTTLAGDYKIIDIGTNGYGDYTRSVILLHEIYNGVSILHNYAVGTITAMRGQAYAFNRMNVVEVNTSSAYVSASGSIQSLDLDVYQSNSFWKLKTCMYSGKKYMAVEIPLGDAHHDHGYKFSGSTQSTGENMKCVSYQVNGLPVNQDLISDIVDFIPDMVETHDVANLNITGNVGIGTYRSTEKLSVNGKIRAREIKVENATWPDYVFAKSYELPTLSETERYINENGHLPGIPSAKSVEANGIDLGEMNAKLLKKIEEQMLYIIEQNKRLEEVMQRLKKLESKKNNINKDI